MIGAGSGAQAFGRKHHVRHQREQRIAVLARLVGIEHHRNAALHPGRANIAHEPGKSIVCDHRIGIGNHRRRVARPRRHQRIVAEIDDGTLAAMVDGNR